MGRGQASGPPPGPMMSPPGARSDRVRAGGPRASGRTYGRTAKSSSDSYQPESAIFSTSAPVCGASIR